MIILKSKKRIRIILKFIKHKYKIIAVNIITSLTSRKKFSIDAVDSLVSSLTFLVYSEAFLLENLRNSFSDKLTLALPED